MKVALVHDYLIDYGGAERVLLALHEMYPGAPIYTIVVDKKKMGKFWKNFEDAEIKESWFGRLPFASRLISPLRFLLPAIWNSFDFAEYDLVITSAAWAVTKGVKKGKDTKEICYIHTPPRWLYGYDESRSWSNKWYGWAIKGYAAIVGHFLRMYDFKQAQKSDYFIANSENVARRVKKFYRRDVDVVIYPPVDVEKFKPLKGNSLKGDYYLAGGRLVSSKNFDCLIKAFNELGLPLKIYGSGRLEDELKSLAKENVELVGRVDDEKLIKLYQGAKAYVVAQKDEDFGITPVEAMAAGTPVIAYRGGGYTESVVDPSAGSGQATGVFFDELTVDSLIKTLVQFNDSNHDIKPSDCIKQAEKFSKDRFVEEVDNFVSRITS